MAALDPAAAAAEWPFAEEGEAREALGLMVAGLARGAGDDGLAWEYRACSWAPRPKPAPPWGSVYTDRECVVFGASTLELRAWMRGRGVARLGSGKDPEDHIGLMLALMAWLARNQPADLRRVPAGAPAHLGAALPGASWPGRPATPSHEGLARLTASTLEGVRAERGLKVAVPRFYR